MSASLKVIPAVLGFSGGAGGGIVYVAVGPTGNSAAAVSEVQGQSSHTHQAQSPLTVNKGKCTAVDPYGKSIFSKLGIRIGQYTVIHCSGLNSDSSVEKWTAVFPDDLFDRSISLVLYGNSVDMYMEKESNGETGESYKATFTSNKFLHSPVIGEWGARDQSIKDGKTVSTVKVKSDKYRGNKNIYLLLNQSV